MADPLRIEITLAGPGEWRVVERSHHAAENVARVLFKDAELASLLAEISTCLAEAHIDLEAQRSRLRRLGSRLAELCLPRELGEKISLRKTAIEFSLDDHAVTMPLELLPNADGVLGEMVPVARHWLCENAGFSQKHPNSRATKQALVVADPAENLPDAQKEGAAIFRILRGQQSRWHGRFLGRAVTSIELSRELPDTDLLHLAAHYVAGLNGEPSGIAVADGLWLPTAASAPEVVFANCCRAGIPANGVGELSLVGHFLKHGSRHVIAPSLPVSDHAARLFATELYQALARDMDISQAVLHSRKVVGPAGWAYWHFGSLGDASQRILEPKVLAGRMKRGSLAVIAVIVVIVMGIVALFALSRNGDRPNQPSQLNAMHRDRNDAAHTATDISEKTKKGTTEQPLTTPVKPVDSAALSAPSTPLPVERQRARVASEVHGEF